MSHKRIDDMENKLKNFIEELANTKVTSNVFNQFDYHCKENSVRRDNLLIYLKQMYLLKPKVLLVAEAPGYKGSRITGVPFTSEHLLMNNMKGLELFGKENGYRLPFEKEKLSKGLTATIIWNTLIELNTISLGWNAFPFHPHKMDDEKSNRTPLKKELMMGESFLQQVIGMFNVEHIVAVGNKAKESLDRMNITCHRVRHPAQGGKNEFVRQLGLIIEKQ